MPMNTQHDSETSKRPIQRWRGDIIGVSVVIAVSCCIYLGYAYSLDNPVEHKHFIQLNMFYPAVFFAAGLGMGTADISQFPELEAFIYRHEKHAVFDTSSIPKTTEIVPLETVWELTHLYYLYFIGFLWRMLGVSVWAVVFYAAILRMASAAALYGLFRFGLGKMTSACGALLIATSPVMLNTAIDLRDFGKAPFILAFLFCMTCLLRQPLSPKRLLATATGAGLLLGIGLGFRQDLLACLPPAFVTIFFFAQVDAPFARRMKWAAALVFVVAFLAASFPVLRGIALEGGQATLHAFFHGISPETETRLAIGGADYDSLISVDPAAFSIVNVYARRMGSSASMANESSSEYRRAHGDVTAPLLWDPYIHFTGAQYARFANKVVGEILWRFPADMALRAWRAVAAFHHMPFVLHQECMNAANDSPQWLSLLMKFHGPFARFMARFGLCATVVVLIAVSMFRWRLALYLTGMLAWFAGYPSLWYEPRHFFFLAFVPVWAILVCCVWPARWCFALRDCGQRQQWAQTYIHDRRWITLALRAGGYVLVMCAVIVLPILMLRAWQSRQVHGLARQLAAASLEPHPVTRERQDGRVYLRPETVLPGLTDAQSLPPGETAWEYVALVLDTYGQDIPVTIHYDDERFIYSFTQTVLVRGAPDGDKGRVTLFFPVYEVDMSYGGDLMAREMLKTFPALINAFGDSQSVEEQLWWRRGIFLGVSVPEHYESHMADFRLVRGIENVPLLPIFQLPENSRLLRTHKTGPWERRLRRTVCPGGRL